MKPHLRARGAESKKPRADNEPDVDLVLRAAVRAADDPRVRRWLEGLLAEGPAAKRPRAGPGN